jgi:hypothetical protein
LVGYLSQAEELVKKSLAIGIAGVTAVVVAAWRQVQRDNTLDTDPAPAARPPSKPDPEPEQTPGPSLFTPSVSEQSTKAELYEVATELKIEGRSKMNKSDLLAAIRAAT